MSASATGEGLALDHVTLQLAGERLFGPLSLRIASGEIVAITGESGSGKSSLLAWICGVLPTSFSAQGRLRLDGADITSVPTEQRRIGILFQDDLLFPHLSVAANLAFGLRSDDGADRRARAAVIAQALDSVGLAGYAGRDPATLSGGQRARVALLRVLLAKPRAVLLDEPFSKLDPRNREAVRTLVFERCRRAGVPTLLVTHDASDTAAAGGRVFNLNAAAAD